MNIFFYLIFFIVLVYAIPLHEISLPQGFWKIQTGSFDQIQGDIMLAYADFTKDRYTDIVAIDSILKQRITLYIWNHTTGEFDKNILNQTISQPIISVIPSDYNYDGHTDLLVVYDLNESYFLEIRLMRNCQIVCQYKLMNDTYGVFENLDPVEPFLIDIDGSRIPQIVVSKNNYRLLIQPYENGTFEITNFQDLIYVAPPPEPEDIEIVPPPPIIYNNPLKNHFASVIDISGDCMADLILISEIETNKVLEYYRVNDNNTLSIPILINISKNVVSLSFSDINFDGAVDLVLLYQENGEVFIQIHFNKYGTQAGALCISSPDFPYDFGELVPGQIKKILRYSLNGSISITKIPVLRFGDLNNDGYPDLVMNLHRFNEFGVLVSYPIFYLNKQCVNESCGSYNPSYTFYANVSNMRYFKEWTINTINITNVHSIVYYDFFQDGRIDILINYFQVKKNKEKIYYIASIYNNKEQDAFFLKMLCLNGAENISKASTNWFGVTYQWKITMLSGQFVHAVGNQQFQLSHQAMQLPFVLAGLGRTNNYIQQFSVGIGQNISNHIRVWTPIVPNTQLIIIPTQKQPSTWKLSIYMQPTQKLKTVFEFTILSLIIIGIMIYYYHNKEKLEDKQNMENFYTLLK